jgi:WD40-like Beta Propeller Repeat
MRNTTRQSRPAFRGGRASALAALVIGMLAAALSPGVAGAGEQRRPASGRDATPWVAYQSSVRGGQLGLEGIFLVHHDGSNDHEVATSLPGQHIHPDWSADGRSLVFRADVGDFPQLFLTNPVGDPTGSRVRQLTSCANDCLQVDDPALSPDGSSVAYVEDTGPPVTVGQIEVPATFDLRVARLTRHGLSRVHTILRTHTVTELVEPRWSPDGRSLVFWSDHTDAATGAVDGTAVFTIRADGTERRQVTPWSMLAGEVDWSPDGRRLVFDTHPLILFNFDDVVSNLFTARPDGRDLRQLTGATTSADRATQPRWTPDGRIIYTRVTAAGRALWLRDADGGHPSPIAPGGLRTHGDVQPVGPARQASRGAARAGPPSAGAPRRGRRRCAGSERLRTSPLTENRHSRPLRHAPGSRRR